MKPFSDNRLANNDSAEVRDSTISSKNFDNLAFDVAKTNSYNAALKNVGIDADGESYINQLKDADNSDVKNSFGKTYGNKIISASIGLSASNGGSAMAAAIIGDVDNNFAAQV